MRTVKFIRSLNVEAARLIDDREMTMEYHRAMPVPRAADRTGMKYLLAENDIVDRVIVPVHHLSRSTIPDNKRPPGPDNEPVVDEMFIAYSDEVADLLGLPVKALTDRVKMQEAEIEGLNMQKRGLLADLDGAACNLKSFAEASLLSRLKYLFTGSL